ncbi:MAG: (Fe-S)-binding protein [Alphaproteobacteria bacterium]|nr:MAG: (Fe-S)-binding protein [Alphaproteobacteria bacterium]TMK35059.1 MAG: (Fe-S)-binding protein [Alphaproteobacteria bacterium]
MSETVGTAGFLDTFRARGAAIADACTRCGDCFRACPMVEPAGLAAADPEEVTGAIVDLITGGTGNADAIRWADVCSGSGNCIPACQHGINPRFMVQLARGFARRNAGSAPLPTRWREPFQNMSRGVRVLSRLQLPPETLARFAPSHEPRTTPPDVVFYTGCNVLKTPHIALLCLDIFDLLGVDYEVMGGVGQCCGVYQYRAGDFETNSKVAYATIDGLASAGASTVLSWCPSCQISIGEVSLPNYEMQFGAKPFDLNPFLIFLADRADQLAALMKHRVERRIALHERPVFPGVVAAVKKLLSIIPGAELVDIDVPRVGTQANSLAQLPKFKRELVQRELQAVSDAGVTTLATIYHACHREICDVGEGRSFEVVNFMELLGEGLGLDSADLYKRLKLIRDIDDIIVETAPFIEANRLDLDTVRNALAFEFGAKSV